MVVEDEKDKCGMSWLLDEECLFFLEGIVVDGVGVLLLMVSWMKRNEWIVYVFVSGVCVVFNGVFVKL